MIAGLKPYPAMKESGVPWLGEVPAHWEVRKLKYAVSFSGGGTPSKANASFWGGRIPWVSPKDMTRARITDSIDHITEEGVLASAASIVAPGALLMVVRSGILRRTIPVAINAVRVALNQDMKALRPRHGVVASEYLRAIVQGNERALIQEWTKQGATVESIEHEFLANSLVPLPSLSEQAAIVRFLDHADRRIRRYIRAKQKLIQLLEEQKQAIIHRAVTRGLDPNVRLKPSGVEWLGNVPEHWSRIAIRHLAARGRSTLVNGPFGSDLLTSELSLVGVPVVYIRDISGGAYRRVSKAHVTAKKAADLDFCRVTPGDVLVAKVGDPPGTAATYPAGQPDGIVTQDVIRIRPDTARVIPRYLVTYLNSRAGRVAVGPVVVESTRGRVSLPDFRAVPVLLPPLMEQQPILNEIVSVTSDIVNTAAKAQREIDLLREFRTRLIADVVTGKLDVREAAARLPETSDDSEPPDLAESDDDTVEDADDSGTEETVA